MKNSFGKVITSLMMITIMSFISPQANANQSYVIIDLGYFGMDADEVPPSRLQPPYEPVILLGASIEGFTRPFGINNLGQVVGWNEVMFECIIIETGERQLCNFLFPFIWTIEDGARRIGYYTGRAAAINDFGQVVGWNDISGIYHGFVWTQADGMVADLVDHAITSINNLGQIIGTPAFLWDEEIGMKYLDPAGFESIIPYDINNVGQVVGYGMLPGGWPIHAFKWTDQQGTLDIHSLGGVSYAWAINDNGEVVGALDSNGFLWTQQGGMQNLGFRSQDINNQGEIVGYKATGGYAAVLYANGVIHDLNDFLPPDSGWILDSAYSINDRGQIVGNGDLNGERHGFLLSPFYPIIVDIMPGSDPNSINLKSRGVVPVAILTTEAFDATIIDPLSVEFGPDGAMETHGRGHIEDIDGDGDLDCVLHFKVQDTGIACGDTSASLTGETFSGETVEGSDSIKTVGCE